MRTPAIIMVDGKFQRVNAIVERDLSGYPAAQRTITDLIGRIESDYQRLLKTPAEDLWRPPTSQRPRMSRSLQRDAEQVVESLDSRGAWVEEGRLRYYGEDDPTRQVIDSRTFCRNLVTLARYVAASE